MTSKKNKVLTGYVHRLADGVLESHAPGDPAPDWITNPELLSDAAAAPVVNTSTDTGNTDGSPAGGEDTGDGLDAMTGDQLKKLAGELELAKSGSKADLIARIRAKREADAEEANSNDADRDSLVEQAKELGIEVDENQSEVELQALIDAAKE